MTVVYPDVSVVICAYSADRWNDLRSAVVSVQAQTKPAREIIVVIDHNDDLLDRVRETMKGVVVIANAGHRGLSGARNSGVAAAQGSIIAFLDDDAVALPEWLERLIGAYTDPHIVSVGGSIEPQWQDHRPAWFPAEFDWVVGCTYRGMPQTTAPVRNLIGANISFRREVFEVVGGFQNGIGRIGTRPLGCEETELCIRTRQRWPWSVFLYEPAAKVYHRVPATRARWSYFRARCYAEGLSKALLSRLVGKSDGLSSERTYTLRTLPKGVARNVAGGVKQGDPAGLGRAAAIVAGLAITTSGYIVGIVIQHVGRRTTVSNHIDRYATINVPQTAGSSQAAASQGWDDSSF